MPNYDLSNIPDCLAIGCNWKKKKGDEEGCLFNDLNSNAVDLMDFINIPGCVYEYEDTEEKVWYEVENQESEYYWD